MGLIAWYPLDGDARDMVGGRHGNIVGNVNWSDGKLGKAASTAYGRHYIRVPHDPELSAKIFGVVPKVSLAAWVKLRSYNDYGLIVGKNSGTSYSNTTNAIWVNRRDVRFVVGSNESSNPSGSTAYAHAGSSFTLNTWHHVAAVLDGDWMGIYVDGVLVDSGSSVLARERSENTADMVIGGPRAGGNEGVDGEIQDVRIYDHALSPREVRDLSLGLVYNDALMQRDIPLTADSHINTGISTSGYLSVGNNFSVVAEFTVDTPPAPRDLGVILGAANYGGLGLIWRCTAEGQLQIGGFARSESESLEIFLDAPVGERIRCVYTHDVENNNSLLMVNGQRTSLTSVAPGAPIRNIAARPELRINAADIFGGSTNTWNRTRLVGTLHQVSWFNEAMTADEVEEFCHRRASLDSAGSLHAVPSEVIAGTGVVGLEHHGVRSEDGAWFANDSYATYEDVRGDLQVQELSVSVWINIDNPSTWRPILLLGEILNSPSSPRNWGHAAYTIWLSNSSLEVMLRGSSYRSPRTNVPNRRWAQVGFTYDGARIKVFIDGAKVADEADSGGITYMGGRRRILQIGGRNSYSWFQGGIRDVAIVGRAVSEQEMATGLNGTTADLLAWLPMRDDTATINSRGRLNSAVSEVGPARGLVAWYPLVNDTLDYAGVNHAVNNGAVLTADGWYFDGSSYISSDTTFETDADGFYCDAGREWSVTQVFSSPDTKLKGVITGKSGGTGSSATYVTYNDNGNIRCRLRGGTVPVLGTAINGQKHAVTITWDGSVAKAYVDGSYAMDVPVGTAGLQSNLFTIGATASGNSTRFNGTVYVVKVHSVALTPEEAAIEAKLALNPETKSAMTQCCLYTRGQIKEVIA